MEVMMKKSTFFAVFASTLALSACMPLSPQIEKNLTPSSIFASPTTTVYDALPYTATLPPPTTSDTTPSLTLKPASSPFLTVSETMIVRKGPGTEFDVLGQIPPNERFAVIGKNVDWWLIDLGNNQVGWVYGPVNIVNFVGNQGVPDVTSPPTPTPEITPTCVPLTQQAEDATKALKQARKALITFFEFLHNGQYEEAAKLYAGGYEVLRDWNPLLDPKDHAALLRNGCIYNGLKCLRVKNIVEEKQVSPVEYHFIVEFMNSDGSLFVRGPCCGANATDMPPQSQFAFIVIRDCEGEFVIPCLPVYVP